MPKLFVRIFTGRWVYSAPPVPWAAAQEQGHAPTSQLLEKSWLGQVSGLTAAPRAAPGLLRAGQSTGQCSVSPVGWWHSTKVASEHPQLRKGTQQRRMCSSCKHTKGAPPPVASGREVFEPQKKVCQMSAGRNCHAELGSPFKAKQTKVKQLQTSRSGPSGVWVCCLEQCFSTHCLTVQLLGMEDALCRRAQSAPAVKGPEPGMSTELCWCPLPEVKTQQHEVVKRGRSCQWQWQYLPLLLLSMPEMWKGWLWV